MVFHPRDIVIHLVLEEFLAGCTDVAGLVKQSIPNMDKCFGLSWRWHVQNRENVVYSSIPDMERIGNIAMKVP